jgi:hypothetical protein
MEQDKITMGRSMFHHACINGYLDVVKYMTKVQMYIQNPSLNDMEVLGKIINLKRGCQPALCINLYLSSYFVNSKKNKQLLLNAADDGLESLELSNLFKLYTDSSLPDQAIRSEIKMVIEKRSLELTNIQNLLKESADAPLITDVLCYYANPDFGPDFSMLNSLIVSGMAISHQNSNGLTLKKYVSTMGYHQNDQKTVQRLIDYSYQRNEAYKNMLATQSMFSQSSIAAQTDLDKQEMTNDTSLAFS